MNKLLRNCLTCVFLLVALVFLMQGVVQAHLYGVTYGRGESIGNIPTTGENPCVTSMLVKIDPNTGVRTEVGNIVGESNSDGTVGYWGIPGIAFHPVTGELYAIGFRCSDPDMENPYLLTLDPCTGYVTSEVGISISDLEETFVRFTDISFQSDGTLFAFYIFINTVGNPEGAVATIDLENGDAEAVGEGTGSIDILGGGIAFLYGDPNNGTLYQAETIPDTPYDAQLNELNPDNGEIEDSINLVFHTPLADGDLPTINAMDSQPGTSILYAAITFNPYTAIAGSTPERWACCNYLATVDEDTGDVKVIGCLSDLYSVITCIDEDVLGGLIPIQVQVRAIAFAPLPVADAGWDFTVEQSSREGGVVCLDGSGSFDYIDCCRIDDGLLEIWSYLEGNTTSYLYGKTPCVVLPVGTHEITLTVDNCNGTDDDTVYVTVQDTIPPIITCLPTIVVEQESHEGTLVDPPLPDVYDVCDPNVTVTGVADPNHPLPYVFPLGRSTITWTATDAYGNTATCTQAVKVVDTTPPVINSVTASPDCLKPCIPLKYEPVTVTVDASDVCDPNPTSKIIGITSNSEPRYCKAPEWFMMEPDSIVYLQAEKNLFEDRIYTITVETTDMSGNSSIEKVQVTVGWSCIWQRFRDRDFPRPFDFPWWDRSEGEQSRQPRLRRH